MSITNLNPREDELERPRLHMQVRLADEICDVYEFSWSEFNQAMKLAGPVFEALQAGLSFPAALAQATDAVNAVLALAIGKPVEFLADERIRPAHATELLAIVFALNQEQLGKALPALLTSLAAKHPAVAALVTKAPAPSAKSPRGSSRRARSR